MRTGESSTVQIVIAIAVALVCIVATLFMYWGMESEKDKIREAKKELEKTGSDLKKLEADANKLAMDACGKKTVKEASADIKNTLEFYKLKLKDSTTDHLKATLEAYVDKSSSLEDDLAKERQTLATIEEQAKSTAASNDARIQADWDRLKATIKSQSERIDNLAKGNEELSTSINAIKDTNKESYGRLLDKLAEEQKEKIEKSKEVDRLKIEIGVLKGTKVKEGEEVSTSSTAYKPDGKILQVEGDVAVIDIGEADGVKPGMIFAIYYTEANSRILKSMAVVKLAEKDARISLARLYRPSEKTSVLDGRVTNLPVIAGDSVAGLFFFRKGHKPVFFLNGTFTTTGPGGMTRDIRDVQRKITEYGGTIANEITADTDYVVLGTNFDARNLELANQFNKKIITRADIMEFLEADGS